MCPWKSLKKFLSTPRDLINTLERYPSTLKLVKVIWGLIRAQRELTFSLFFYSSEGKKNRYLLLIEVFWERASHGNRILNE